MTTVKSEKITYSKENIDHVIAELSFLEGFLQAKLQTGQAKRVEDILKLLRKE